MVAMEQLELIEPWNYRTNVSNGALGGYSTYGAMGPMDIWSLWSMELLNQCMSLYFGAHGVFRRSGLIAALGAVRNYRLEPTPVELLG